MINFLELLNKRRSLFEKLLPPVENNLTNIKLMNSCPACGYPTLKIRGNMEICGLCLWEDNGCDDYSANLKFDSEYTLNEYRFTIIKNNKDFFQNEILEPEMKEIRNKMAILNKYEDLLYDDNTQINQFMNTLNNLIETLNERRFGDRVNG